MIQFYWQLFYFQRTRWGSLRCQSQFKQERIETKLYEYTRTKGRENYFTKTSKEVSINACRTARFWHCLKRKKLWLQSCVPIAQAFVNCWKTVLFFWKLFEKGTTIIDKNREHSRREATRPWIPVRTRQTMRNIYCKAFGPGDGFSTKKSLSVSGAIYFHMQPICRHWW